MTVRLIVGPPGAGKSHYVKEHAKESDLVIDLDQIREHFPEVATAKNVRKSMESALKDSKSTRDAWVIRTAADPRKRKAIADRCGASEVVVIETPADLAKERVAERDKDNPELVKELSDSIDHWWNQYAMVESDLIVKPDTGNLSDREKPMSQKHGENNNSDHDGNQDEQQKTDKGFPADTPVADMTAEQQAAYWKYHSRKHETLAKAREDYDQMKALAEKWTEHEKASKPADQVKAEEDAEEIRKAAEKAVSAKFATKLVTAEFKAATAGRIKSDDLTEILEDMDLTRYLNDDGEVDVERVTKKAAIIAPETRSSNGTRRTHQQRRTSDTSSSIESGRDLYAETHGRNKN